MKRLLSVLALVVLFGSFGIAQATPLSPRLRQLQFRLNQDLITASVVSLEPGSKLRPVWRDPQQLSGAAALPELAGSLGAMTAINGGFFNRNTRQPLGALRVDGQWISSPILGRGVVAWDDAGRFAFGRLRFLSEVRPGIPLTTMNSGYLLPGIAQYTPSWGSSYATQTDGETVLVVEASRVTAIYPGAAAGSLTLAIPQQGYLLTARQPLGAQQAQQFAIGDTVALQWKTDPPELESYPHLLGAGPLLLQDGQVVLDAELEQFRPQFRSQRAARSAICQTQQNAILLVTTGQGQESNGISLSELTEVLRQLGCRHALNLDGGSSSTLMFQGSVVNLASGSYLPRIHNGLVVLP